jgi:hypothetical protein
MAWEHGRYYTQTVRFKGVRVRKYFGRNALAYFIAADDVVRRSLRQAAAGETRARNAAWADLDCRALALEYLAKAVVGALLTASGHHAHKGQWRKRRARGSGPAT